MPVVDTSLASSRYLRSVLISSRLGALFGLAREKDTKGNLLNPEVIGAGGELSLHNTTLTDHALDEERRSLRHIHGDKSLGPRKGGHDPVRHPWKRDGPQPFCGDLPREQTKDDVPAPLGVRTARAHLLRELSEPIGQGVRPRILL